MANMSGVQEATAAPATLSRFARLPWRRIIQVLLAIGIGLFVAIGSFRTLQSNTYDASTWKNFIILGVAQGGIYALIALGYTLVYGVLRMINFAHGEVFMFGAFGSYFFATAYASSGFLNRNPVIALAIIFLVGDDGLVLDRDAAGTGRLPAVAQRAAPRAAHHGDRSIPVPAEHGVRALRPTGARVPRAGHPERGSDVDDPRHHDAADPGGRDPHRDHRRGRA